MGLISKLFSGISGYIYPALFVAGIALGASGAWYIQEQRLNAQVLSVRAAYDEYRISVTQAENEDTALALQTYKNATETLQKIQQQVEKETEIRNQASDQLLERLKDNEKISGNICPADAAYLDELRKLQQSGH